MLEELEADYPDAAQYIQQAIEDPGEQWILDNYHNQIKPLDRFMPVPDIEELPFYDDNETLDHEGRVEHAEMLRKYRENLRNGGQEGLVI
jgi:hypothetical protein